MDIGGPGGTGESQNFKPKAKSSELPNSRKPAAHLSNYMDAA